MISSVNLGWKHAQNTQRWLYFRIFISLTSQQHKCVARAIETRGCEPAECGLGRKIGGAQAKSKDLGVNNRGGDENLVGAE
jgi:hypothetical protein